MKIHAVARTLSWVLRLTAAVILVQTLFFKFTGAEESVYIFRTLGMEPWGRFGSGAVELVASALLLWTPTVALGAAVALGVMSGAIVSHLTTLGVEVLGDGGLLFVLACIVWGASALLIWLHRGQLPVVGAWLEPRMSGSPR
jgi:putative oxidoreductase